MIFESTGTYCAVFVARSYLDEPTWISRIPRALCRYHKTMNVYYVNLYRHIYIYGLVQKTYRDASIKNTRYVPGTYSSRTLVFPPYFPELPIFGPIMRLLRSRKNVFLLVYIRFSHKFHSATFLLIIPKMWILACVRKVFAQNSCRQLSYLSFLNCRF